MSRPAPPAATPDPVRRPRGGGLPTALIAIVVVGLVVVAVAVLVAIASFDPFGSETVDRSGPAVLERIRELEEFTAAEGSFSQDVDIEEDAAYLPDFLSGQRIVALVTGTVRATVDLGQLDEDAVTVSDDGTTIRLSLPDPVLTDPEIDVSSARIVSRQRGLIDRVDDFFSGDPIDDSPVYRAAEDKVAEAAASSDLVEEGRANTERWLTTFLRAAAFETVEIDWQRPPT